MWLCSSGVVEFTWLRSVCRWVHPGSLISLGWALGVVRFIRGHWVNSLGSVLVVVGYILGRSVRPGSHWLYLGSSRVVGFTQFRPVFRWVHPGSLGSSGDVGFTRVHTGCRAFIRGRWVHSGAPWGLMDSSRVVKFTRVRPGGHCVYVGSLGSLVFALGVVGFIWIIGLTRVPLSGCWVHPQSLSSRWGISTCWLARWCQSSLEFALDVVRFIRRTRINPTTPSPLPSEPNDPGRTQRPKRGTR